MDQELVRVVAVITRPLSPQEVTHTRCLALSRTLSADVRTRSDRLSGGSKVAIGTSVARLGGRGDMARFGECYARPIAHTSAA
jgi:hypothetical protein